LENLEKNTIHWRELCDSQQQECLSKGLSSGRNESIVEDIDENNT
jgi:hypothetical protein